MGKVDYTAIAKEAQESVEGIKDPELKRVAFEKILDDLLRGGEINKSSEGTPNEAKKSKLKSTSVKKSSKNGPQGQIKILIEEGFFAKPKTISEVKSELATRGFHIPLTHLSPPLMRLCRQKLLRRGKGSGGTYLYSNW